MRQCHVLFATHVVLEDAEAKYEAIKIDLKKGDQQRPEFLESKS